MKTKFVVLALVSAFSLQPSAWLHAATSIDNVNRSAYGANVGWMDWTGDTANGAVIGDYVCFGYVYGANVGWINLGSGSPTNGIRYLNLDASDFGVNHDGLGNLRGYAWGANVGWIAFEDNGAPKLDLLTGKFSGYVYSANCGWISLSNAVAFVQTDSLDHGALAPDGLPIAWLLANFGTTNVNANADPDGDGQSNQQEYLAGTNPNDAGDYLHITGVQRGDVGDPHYVILTWTSQPTRFYAIQGRSSLDASTSWGDLYSLPWPGINNVGFDSTAGQNFYRIRATRPLSP